MKKNKLEKMIIASLLMCNAYGGIRSASAESSTIWISAYNSMLPLSGIVADPSVTGVTLGSGTATELIGVKAGDMAGNVKEIITCDATGGLRSGGYVANTAYGIQVTGSNSVSATSISDGITVMTMNSGHSAYGISFGTSNAAATGTLTISDLGNLKAHKDDPTEVTNTGTATGIFVNNGNTTGTNPTFSVTFKTTGGTIDALTSYESGAGTGIEFGTGGGKSEIKNVDKIKAGDANRNGAAYGIKAAGGENTVMFTGSNCSIAARSNLAGGNDAYGIFITSGTTIVSGLKQIDTSTATGKASNSMCVNGGNLILQPPETKNGSSYMGANSPISMIGGRLAFDLPAACAKDDVILNITGGSGSQLTGGTISVINGRATGLQVGEEICLIQDYAPINFTGVAKQHSTDGIAWGEAEIYLNATDNTKLMYKKTKVEVAQGGSSKAPVEGLAAASVVVNSSTDLIVGAGMANMITTTASEGGGAEPFGAANFGSNRYETGSHVDAKGYSIVVGVGKKVFNKQGDKTTGGLFVEYGNSNFDTYNDNSVHGDGKNIYKGAGYMMRWDNKKSGNYYEGMIHAGKTNTSWSNNNLGAYNVNPTYYGGALTYGHKFMFKKNNQVSTYGMYIFNRTGSADANIKGYTYNFDATNSRRTRIGVRYAKSDLMDTLKYRPYVGLAWEHEFGGETSATIMSGPAYVGSPASPSMKGNTGILEFGCNMESGKWTLGAGASLYAGKRRGWTGTLQATYNF